MDRKTIAVCLPGEVFSQNWVSGWTSLLAHLLAFHKPLVLFAYTSTVNITRGSLVDAFMKMEESEGVKFDYALWLDDDNTLTPEQFELLLADLENVKELSGVVGWTWCQPNGMRIAPKMSCGMFDETGECSSFEAGSFLEAPSDLIGIDYSGFPACLFRWDVMKELGRLGFKPILDRENYWGMAGEDISWFLRAKGLGFKFAVDRRVKVPHFKLRDAAEFSLEDVVRGEIKVSDGVMEVTL